MKKRDTKVALVGCGPASMSCASFLARLGYDNIHLQWDFCRHGGDGSELYMRSCSMGEG